MPVPHLRGRRRLAACLALCLVPLAAVTACGTQQVAQRASVQTALQQASGHLRASRATSVVLHVTDPRGTLAAAASGTGDLSRSQADLLLGATVTLTVDPAGTATLGSLSQNPAPTSSTDAVRAVNVALTVQATGGTLAQLRLVGGDLYLNADLGRLSSAARTAGSPTDLGDELDQAAAESPDELGPLLAAARAGEWVKIPMSAYADRLGDGPAAVPSVDPQSVRTDLLTAVRPFTTVTDASSTGGTRVLDVRVAAKKTLKAAVGALQAALPSLGALSPADLSGLDRLGDGTVTGQVTLQDGHLTRVTLDLASLTTVSLPGSVAPDLTGSTLTVDVDDAAPEVTVPQHVSTVDVTGLVQQLLGVTGTAG